MLEFVNIKVRFKVFSLSVLTLIFVKRSSDLSDCEGKLVRGLGFRSIGWVFKKRLVRWSVL